MSATSCISLLDLGQQLPFNIDDKIKNDLCFAETLIVSCGHYECKSEEEFESDSSCDDTSESEISEVVKDSVTLEVKDNVEEISQNEDVVEEENDFHIYFFPDCTEPPPKQDSKSSFIIVDGMPQINPLSKVNTDCTCELDKDGKCPCHTKLPCKCGLKTNAECTCAKLNEICICHDGKPQPVCTCKSADVCICHPKIAMQPVCTCNAIEKPCICQYSMLPNPVCTCQKKPQAESEQIETNEVLDEQSIAYPADNLTDVQDKCDCQKEDPKSRCFCLKGKECICNLESCVCGVQKHCLCEPTPSEGDIKCKPEDSKSICSCPVHEDCTCEHGSQDNCNCFPEKVCTCGDPENCHCFKTCKCSEPCICDISVKNELQCTCSDNKAQAKSVPCLCKPNVEHPKKLKRVRAGKHGYRWCHDVDPKHTFFGYGYGRHDKIDYKEPEVEKVKILGLHEDNKETANSCEEQGVAAPSFVKKPRKPSVDCCSSVGGINICVETLGEDKDKFLVQVVSHSSNKGAKSGSKLVSILDCNLHTMEENRSEHKIKNGIIKEHKSYMAICDSGYYNKVTRVCGEKNVVKRLYHTFEDAHSFLLEGANVVLLRYFGLIRYRGNVKTDTVLINGTICESIYVCQGVSQAIVNNQPLFVVKVERHIIEPGGVIHQTLTVLTLRGYMVSHEWADNNYILHINPLLRIIPEKDEIESHAPLREKWRDDLQLLSDYLDFKSTRTSEGGRYVTESGALTNTIRDYLQALLFLRPHDALHFTRHYFGTALSALELPHDEYFDPTSKHVRYYFFEE